MNKRVIGIVLLLGGAAVAIASLAADVIGIGDNPVTFEIGWKQIIGAIFGLLSIIVGIWYIVKGKKPKDYND